MAIAFDPEQIEDIQVNIVETVEGVPIYRAPNIVYRYYTRPVYTEPIFTWGGGGGSGVNITPMHIYSTAQAEEIERVRSLKAGYALQAEKLLWSLLSPLQQSNIDKYGAFDVRGSEGGKFRISVAENSCSFNLMDLESEKYFCFFMHDGAWGVNFPEFDQFVAQAIVIRTNEPLVRSYPQITRVQAIGSKRDLLKMFPWED